MALINVKVVMSNFMQKTEYAKRVFSRYGWIMRTKELHKERIYYKDIQFLVEHGLVAKIRYGYYQWMDYENLSEAYTVSHLFPDAIMCMDTALFYHGYSDRIPLVWHLAVSKDSNKSRFRIEYPLVKPYYVESTLLDLGRITGDIDGHPVHVYDKERTVCDCLRYMGKMDKETFNKAIRGYVEDNRKNIQKLMEYATKLRVVQKVKTIVGVWL